MKTALMTTAAWSFKSIEMLSKKFSKSALFWTGGYIEDFAPEPETVVSEVKIQLVVVGAGMVRAKTPVFGAKFGMSMVETNVSIAGAGVAASAGASASVGISEVETVVVFTGGILPETDGET
ncbi:hypothetical protein R1flu_004436 [Riccia fluitans]|uniref:Uncharacterized protein n=1 Tax=Riccia fluitans TaxID=41844 RepID=A0ABD1YQA5_9MARC